ncbi:MAG: phosphonate ABC transporter substrate-binding protein, partial [Mesorhizobium sp.]
MFRKMVFSAVSILAMAASAAHAADVKEFRVGILGGENETDRLRNYQCLADHLKAEFGASGYASVYLKDPKAVTPILTTKQTDGSTGYYSIGLALKTSGITDIKSAKGKKLGYADPDSTSGYLIPLT